jgi:lipooligosaccharide transport system permease protein
MAIGAAALLQPQPRQALNVWYRHFLCYLRFYRTSILLNFVEPITGLVALGIALGQYVHLGSGTFLQFVGPGLVCVTAMNAVSFDTCFSTYNFLFENKVYPSMIASPLEIDDLVAGTMLWEATRAVIYGGVFMIVITAFGLVHTFAAVLVIPVLFLSGLMFAAPALCVASLARQFQQMFYYMTLVITPMTMFAGIFFPLSRLNWKVQTVIWFTPLYHVAHLVRGLCSGTLDSSNLVDLAWICLFTFVVSLFPSRLIRARLLI